MDTSSIENNTKYYLIEKLKTYKLIAHNVNFDAAALYNFTGVVELPWKWCTYGLFRQIVTEGYPGQKWGLKTAMVDLLGWTARNDIELIDWLAANGFTKGKLKAADKAQMWRAPTSILGTYCAYDAEACLQLFTLFDQQVLQDHPALAHYHTDIFIPNVLLHVEQLFRGIKINTVDLATYRKKTIEDIEKYTIEFLEHPIASPHIQAYEQQQYEEYHKATPKGRLTQDRFKFNINSKQQLRWLFFSRLYTFATYFDRKSSKWKAVINGSKKIIIELTPTKQVPMSKKVLPFLGELGSIVLEINKLTKMLGYITAVLEEAEENGGILHPKFKLPGTITGRVAGGMYES